MTLIVVVSTTVNPSEKGKKFQIEAGKCVHYYSPDNLPTLTKQIIFYLHVQYL